MIYITQLIFVRPGKEASFLEFEEFAIPMMEKYHGKVLYRVRPEETDFINNHQSEMPYEIHIISFESEEDLTAFLHDDQRLAYIHLKEESVNSTLLLKGTRM